MKIIMLLGSPHANGTTAHLAEAFRRGAEAAGHTVTAFSAAAVDILPCLGCNVCRKTGNCVRRDGAGPILDALEQADGILFVSPLYYFGFTAQLKTIVDRFYGRGEALRTSRPKTALLTAGADGPEAFDAILASYGAICRYMHFQNAGTVTAALCASPEAKDMPRYLAEAETLGKEF